MCLVQSKITMGIKRNKKLIIIAVICLCGVIFLKGQYTIYMSSAAKGKEIELVTKEKLKKSDEKVLHLEKLLKLQSLNESEIGLRKKFLDLQDKHDSLEKILKQHGLLYTNEISPERGLGRELDFSALHTSIESNLTVILFSSDESIECLKNRIDKIRKEYPRIKTVVISSSNYPDLASSDIDYIPDIKHEGKALQLMSTRISSTYFLYLSPGAELSPHKSDKGIGWLLQAMEKIPELDFIGGSFLRYEDGVRYPVLEIPCHRLRLCNWTLSQTFEYRYSVDDMMVCEETSSSFMGRVNSLQKVGPFDSNLDSMATTDFFLRAKGKAVVGLRPEVIFPVSKQCIASPLSKTEAANRQIPFMRKYQLYITKDSFGRETLATDSKDFASLDYGIVFFEDGTYASPMYIRGLLLNLEVAADYLESKNITYFLDSGFSLGGVKMRGILPWDRDIDLGFFYDWQPVKEGLEEYCKTNGIKATVTTSDLEGGKKELFLRAGDFGYNTMYQQDMVESGPEMFMYIYIHGRRYPVKKYLFESLRVSYGKHYLEMHGTSGRLKCSKPGHHACVPEEFAKGGGHWRDYYCQL